MFKYEIYFRNYSLPTLKVRNFLLLDNLFSSYNKLSLYLFFFLQWCTVAYFPEFGRLIYTRLFYKFRLRRDSSMTAIVKLHAPNSPEGGLVVPFP